MWSERWNVIPIIRNEKRPAVEHVADWFDKKYDRDEMPEHCNYAVICGEISDNLIVIDLDYARPTDYTTEIYPLLNAELGDLVNTYTEGTPNGTHLFYKLDGKIPSSGTNTNTGRDDLKKQILEHVNGKRKKLNLRRIEKTIWADKLHSVDLLADKKYCLISPSKIDKKQYRILVSKPILTISEKGLKRILDYFLLEKTIASRIRKPFTDILTGKIEIEQYSREHNKDEHVYWISLFKEVYHFLGLEPEDIYPLLRKNQPAFDETKTEQQLNSPSHDHTSKPLKNETLAEYFPTYKITATRTFGDPLYVTIARQLLERYNIITLRDQKETMLIRRGNTYNNDLDEFYKDLANRIKETGKNITYMASNIIKYIKFTTYFNTEELCYDNWLISFKNGYYDARDDLFYDNSNSEKMFCYEIPHNYNKNFKGDCPMFKALLESWLDPDGPITIDDMFEMIGYTMMMNTDMKMAFFIYGPPHTGKTQFQTILEHVVGHINRCDVSLQRMCRDHFGSNGLQFKTLNMIGDMGDEEVVDTSMFKKLTGTDKWVGAEQKGGAPYQFRNIVKIWCNGNFLPKITKEDDAFYTRWILILFPNQHEMYDNDTIKDIGDKLCQNKQEIQGIIHEAIKGVKRLYKRQYFRRELIENTKHTWRYQAEPLYAFLHDNYITDEDGKVPIYEFRSKFNRFLYTRKEKSYSNYQLNNLLETHGIYKTQIYSEGMREYFYTGISKKLEYQDIKKDNKNNKKLSDFDE